MNRLLETRSQPAATGQLPSVYGYAYNNASQRINTRLADGSYWVYQYDKLGQVISGKKFWPDGAPGAGPQFEYALDTIGNRASAKAGGDQNGKNLQSSRLHFNGGGIPIPFIEIMLRNPGSLRDIPGW